MRVFKAKELCVLHGFEIVVENGQIIEIGTHAELVAQNGRYATMFQTWSAAGTNEEGNL